MGLKGWPWLFGWVGRDGVRLGHGSDDTGSKHPLQKSNGKGKDKGGRTDLSVPSWRLQKLRSFSTETLPMACSSCPT